MIYRITALGLTLIAFAGCDKVNSMLATDAVVVDKATQLEDGRGIYWNIEPGRYKIELNSTSDGANIEWVGASCPGANEVKQYSIMCDMPTNGQVIVKNPTILGLGPAINVSIRITHLAK